MLNLELKKIDAGEWIQLLNNKIPPYVTGLFVILLAHTTATLTWQFVPSSPDVLPPPIAKTATSSSTKTRPDQNKQNYAQLSNWHLFGAAQKEMPKPVQRVIPDPIPQEAPDTTLRLDLKGVFASKDMMDAFAIIADRMGNEDSYSIDSALPGGAILKEIYSDRVILLHNGRLETLRLLQDGLATKKKSSNRATSRSNNRHSHRRNVSRSQPRGNVNQVSFEATQVLKGYRDKLINDPQSVMNTVRAEPYRQGGRLQGYRIFPGRDKDLFNQLGLQPGDVVTTVNGINLDSPLKGLEIMQNIQDATEVSVDVLRNGVNQTYVVPMN